MFQGTLLESSAIGNRRSRWPMATGFTLQFIIASALVIVPLFTSGIIPVSSHIPLLAPARYTPLETARTVSSGCSDCGGVRLQRERIVTLTNTAGRISDPFAKHYSGSDQNSDKPNLNIGTPGTGISLIPEGQPIPVPPPAPKERIRISQPSEAMLVNKVIPEYPTIAVRAGVQGEVKLHAIIAKDGSIQSLQVISGHPLLTRAALEAVSQWKYRPYTLSGVAVEVETYITVSFKRTN
jgi:periplasmic protein TonB